MAKRTGRPSIDPSTAEGAAPVLAARVPAPVVAALDAEVKRRGIARSDAVREALVMWLDAEGEGARRAG
jgi:Arc/MetJ-type ribon-helix-helix transcriptional regulator